MEYLEYTEAEMDVARIKGRSVLSCYAVSGFTPHTSPRSNVQFASVRKRTPHHFRVGSGPIIYPDAFTETGPEPQFASVDVQAKSSFNSDFKDERVLMKFTWRRRSS